MYRSRSEINAAAVLFPVPVSGRFQSVAATAELDRTGLAPVCIRCRLADGFGISGRFFVFGIHYRIVTVRVHRSHHMSDRFQLDHLAALDLEGPSALAFCQAQLSAEIESLTPGQWHAAAWCDARGRVLAFILACRHDEAVTLIFPESQQELIGRRLPMYAIGHRVEFGRPGPVAASLAPETDDGRLAFAPGAALFTTPAPAPDEHQQRAWEKLEFGHALPWLEPDTSARYLPQMLGLEALDAVSFDKGCFPGQEVIARTHYLGRVKRKLTGVRFNRTLHAKPGMRLLDEDGNGIGELLRVSRHLDSACALAVVSVNRTGNSRVLVELPDGRAAARLSPPEGLC